MLLSLVFVEIKINQFLKHVKMEITQTDKGVNQIALELFPDGHVRAQVLLTYAQFYVGTDL